MKKRSAYRVQRSGLRQAIRDAAGKGQTTNGPFQRERE
jgi:hypothetical protein